MEKTISSLQNPLLKKVIKLKKENYRKKEDVIVIEGEKELQMAIESGLKIEEVIFCEKLNDFGVEKFSNYNINNVSEKIFRKLSVRENPDGVIVLGRRKDVFLKDVKIKDNMFILALENIEKPGNLGAIIRSADAAGFDLIVLIDTKIDKYNPNVIRNSRGSVFVLPIIKTISEDYIKWSKENFINNYVATPEEARNYTEFNYKGKISLLLGNEHKGVSEKLRSKFENKVKIPMLGKIDSLNVSVAAAILMYEIVRQHKI